MPANPLRVVIVGGGFGGLYAARALAGSPAAVDKSGRVIVNPDLSIPGHPEVFAIGDTAHVVAPARNLLGIREKDPMLLPGVAQPAIQEGRYVARIIRRRVLALKPPRPFWYWDKGDLAIVGRVVSLNSQGCSLAVAAR